MRKLFKDKKGEGMFLFYMLLIIVAGMFLALHFNTTMLILERGKLYAVADEAADRAVWAIYQYDEQDLESGGKPDVNADMSLAALIAQQVFASNGFVLQNAKAHMDGSYLVVEGDVGAAYKQPTLSGAVNNVWFHVEGRAPIAKVQ